MRTILRYLWYTWLRVHDAVVGPQLAVFRRMQRQGRASMGPNSYGIPMIKHFVLDQTRLEIGNYCSLSGEATVFLGGRHATDKLTTYPHRINWGLEGAGTDGFPTPTGDTVIGSDVWLCPGSIVVSGVRIGHGAIVAAGSVITKDVPDFAVVGGNPARVIKYRFPEEQRKAMLEIAWWDWPEDKVREAVPLLADDDVDALVAFAHANGLVEPGKAPTEVGDTDMNLGTASGPEGPAVR